MSREPGFWRAKDSFVLVCKSGSFKNPFETITTLSEPYFTLIQKVYSVGANERNDFYELWQQHKLLKIMEISEVSPDEGYIHQFQPEHTHKIH